ncbi:hypothetical protein JW926_07905 [Candidatus Sumerlaeota bacterium]|nr:hypothetical protein [Candidatus Sumerlaeota bacterium]
MPFSVKIKSLAACVFLYMPLSPFYVAHGCNAPVYRYAMQYWRQGVYQALCLHKGPLSEAERNLLQRFQDQSLSGQSAFNFIIETLDISIPGSEKELPAGLSPDHLPSLVIYYPPGVTGTRIAWHGSLDEDLLEKALDSPVRSKIAENLAGGKTAVWIFLESGNQKLDSEKLSLLKRELERLQSELKLSDQSQTAHYSSNADSDEEASLRIDFSTIVLSPKDPQEEILLSFLLHSEPDLEQYKDFPKVFPVYGRGRVLYALVGNGITPENIRKTAEFFIAPCTCILKETNTGIDLLMTTQWGDGSFLSADQESLSDFRESLGENPEVETERFSEPGTGEIIQEKSLHHKARTSIIITIIIIPAAVLFLAAATIIKRKRMG